MKKYLPLLGLVLAILPATAQQQHSLEKLWTSDSTLKTPESVLLDTKNKCLYVSNIDGGPLEKDGKGSIAKLGLDGKILQQDWVSGLNAPKGMGLYKDKLYVADLTEVVVIDVKKAQIEKRIPVEGAIMLNDISIDKTGRVFVSDSRNFKVHRIENGNVFTELEKLQGPNGVLSINNDLLVLDRGSLLHMKADGQISKLAEGMDPSTDGIEQVKEHEYLVSCWSGIIYYVHAGGQKQVLLDTRQEKINTADIGYDAKNRILYVPTFYKNTVVAYRLQ
jgi:sugar lactone lactonase YvrE